MDGLHPSYSDGCHLTLLPTDGNKNATRVRGDSKPSDNFSDAE
jgi:hypothetical protein